VSIGLMHDIRATVLTEGNTVINGRGFRGPLLVVTKWPICEISLTMRRADVNTFLILTSPERRPASCAESRQ
jgi:hypothetical protein